MLDGLRNTKSSQFIPNHFSRSFHVTHTLKRDYPTFENAAERATSSPPNGFPASIEAMDLHEPQSVPVEAAQPPEYSAIYRHSTAPDALAASLWLDFNFSFCLSCLCFKLNII